MGKEATRLLESETGDELALDLTSDFQLFLLQELSVCLLLPLVIVLNGDDHIGCRRFVVCSGRCGLPSATDAKRKRTRERE